jgi:hypothetical protein
MTYHENNNPSPNPGYKRNTSFVWVLGLAAVLIIGGLLFMTMGSDDNVVTRTDRVTTGAGSTLPAPATRDLGTGTNQPAANRPTQVPGPRQ